MNKKQALQNLIESLKNSDEPIIKSALDVLTKSTRGRSDGMISKVYDALANHYISHGNKPLPCNEIYEKYGVGVHELNNRLKRHYVKNVAPEKRLWLTVDVTARTVTVHAIGSTPPVGWAGYIPVKGLDKYGKK